MKKSEAPVSGARVSCRMLGVAIAVTTLLADGAHAVTFETGDPDLRIQWDNTVKLSTAYRLKKQDAALLSNPNADDGDRNFDKGIISERVDLLSELDVHYQAIGARVSGAAWYDEVYNQKTDNPGFAGGAYPNHEPFTAFPSKTRDLAGRYAEVLDAFAFAKFDLGDSPALLRVGRHTIVWGESLFLGANAVAGAMAPVDVTKLEAVPGTQFKEAIRPVPQISGQIQVTPAFTVAGYYQFRFEPNRLPAVGSYFSATDTNVDGGEQLLLGPLGSAQRQPDLMAKNSGQGGLQTRLRVAETDISIFAVRFHDKAQQVVTNLINLTPEAAPTLIPGSYYVTYHEGITALGASASHTFGPANVAIEASIHNNQDLASAGHAADLSQAFGGPATNNSNNPGYSVGRTAHVNVSSLVSIGPTPLFNEANLAAEIAWNRVLRCTKNCAVYDPTTQQGYLDNNATRDATSMRLQFTPSYRQVLAGLDLGVPLGVGYTPSGSRSMALGSGAFPGAGGGDMSIGLDGAYLDVWRFTAGLTHYFGKAAPFLDSNNSFSYGQSLRDRDFVAFSIRRTF